MYAKPTYVPPPHSWLNAKREEEHDSRCSRPKGSGASYLHITLNFSRLHEVRTWTDPRYGELFSSTHALALRVGVACVRGGMCELRVRMGNDWP